MNLNAFLKQFYKMKLHQHFLNSSMQLLKKFNLQLSQVILFYV